MHLLAYLLHISSNGNTRRKKTPKKIVYQPEMVKRFDEVHWKFKSESFEGEKNYSCPRSYWAADLQQSIQHVCRHFLSRTAIHSIIQSLLTFMATGQTFAQFLIAKHFILYCGLNVPFVSPFEICPLSAVHVIDNNNKPSGAFRYHTHYNEKRHIVRCVSHSHFYTNSD